MLSDVPERMSPSHVASGLWGCAEASGVRWGQWGRFECSAEGGSLGSGVTVCGITPVPRGLSPPSTDTRQQGGCWPSSRWICLLAADGGTPNPLCTAGNPRRLRWALSEEQLPPRRDGWRVRLAWESPFGEEGERAPPLRERHRLKAAAAREPGRSAGTWPGRAVGAGRPLGEAEESLKAKARSELERDEKSSKALFSPFLHG